MTPAEGVIILLLVALLSWALRHTSQCSALRERVATLEQLMRDRENEK